jgi:hypothetical protein
MLGHAADWRHKLDAQRGAVLAVELKVATSLVTSIVDFVRFD